MCVCVYMVEGSKNRFRMKHFFVQEWLISAQLKDLLVMLSVKDSIFQ